MNNIELDTYMCISPSQYTKSAQKDEVIKTSIIIVEVVRESVSAEKIGQKQYDSKKKNESAK